MHPPIFGLQKILVIYVSVRNDQAQKHNSPLVSLDFSEDSHYIQSASEDNELLYREFA